MRLATAVTLDMRRSYYCNHKTQAKIAKDRTTAIEHDSLLYITTLTQLDSL